MSSRNSSVKAAFVFSGILAVGLVGATAVQAKDTVRVQDTGALLEPTAPNHSLDVSMVSLTASDDDRETDIKETDIKNTNSVEQVPIFTDGLDTGGLETGGLEIESLDMARLSDIERAILADSEAALIELAEALERDSAVAAATTEGRTDEIAGDVSVNASSVETSVAGAATAEMPGAITLGSLENVTLLSAMATETAALALVDSEANPATQRGTIAALSNALGSENIFTRLYAADLLWNLTGDRTLILPMLSATASSQDLQARELALFALSQIATDINIASDIGIENVPAANRVVEAVSSNVARPYGLAQDALNLARSEHRPTTVLGILTRESRRVLIPPAIRAITRFWR